MQAVFQARAKEYEEVNAVAKDAGESESDMPKLIPVDEHPRLKSESDSEEEFEDRTVLKDVWKENERRAKVLGTQFQGDLLGKQP